MAALPLSCAVACQSNSRALLPPSGLSPAYDAPASCAQSAFLARTVAWAAPATIKRVWQPDWAGPVLFSPGEKPMKIPPHRFCAIEGEWTVPKARPTINCHNRWEQADGSSLWIAIDGWSGTFKAHERGKDDKWHTYDSTDILQAGSESDVPCYHGGSPDGYPTTAYFWIEWSGKRNIRVTQHHRNLPLHPGDRIDVRIAADITGTHAWRRATLWLVNETTGDHYPPRTFDSGCVDSGDPWQRPATLFGNTAEWIVEATFYSSVRRRLPNTLNDFGSVTMDRVSVTDQDGVTYDLTHANGATRNLDWMTWNGVPLNENGTLLACTTISGERSATFTRAPYVIVTPGQQGKLEPKPKNCR
ncbi:MAG TPA: G1 family glutamic endopeptidase [Candidatus Cybelea sp.]